MSDGAKYIQEMRRVYVSITASKVSSSSLFNIKLHDSYFGKNIAHPDTVMAITPTKQKIGHIDRSQVVQSNDMSTLGGPE